MQYITAKHFEKQFALLSKASKAQVLEKIALFLADPYHPSLSNHALAGKWRTYRSVNIKGDVRLVYREVTKDTVLFVAIGTHSQLYR